MAVRPTSPLGRIGKSLNDLYGTLEEKRRQRLAEDEAEAERARREEQDAQARQLFEAQMEGLRRQKDLDAISDARFGIRDKPMSVTPVNIFNPKASRFSLPKPQEMPRASTFGTALPSGRIYYPELSEDRREIAAEIEQQTRQEIAKKEQDEANAQALVDSGHAPNIGAARLIVQKVTNPSDYADKGPVPNSPEWRAQKEFERIQEEALIRLRAQMESKYPRATGAQYPSPVDLRSLSNQIGATKRRLNVARSEMAGLKAEPAPSPELFQEMPPILPERLNAKLEQALGKRRGDSTQIATRIKNEEDALAEEMKEMAEIRRSMGLPPVDEEEGEADPRQAAIAEISALTRDYMEALKAQPQRKAEFDRKLLTMVNQINAKYGIK